MKTYSRSADDKVFGGVCGGLARTFGIDAVYIRGAALFFMVIGVGIPFIVVAYLLALFAYPQLPDSEA